MLKVKHSRVTPQTFLHVQIAELEHAIAGPRGIHLNNVKDTDFLEKAKCSVNIKTHHHHHPYPFLNIICKRTLILHD